MRAGAAGIHRPGTAYDGPRLTQIDGLRALAALVVVAYHYTTRFEQRFMHVSPLGISVPWGYFGVNLFFAISGFVICMTLDRCRTPQDFIVSRFARLYPTFWVAVAVTWLTIQLHTMPGYAISLKAAIANLSMVHAFFGIPDVDGVYWSLQVELLFYIWMLAIWSLGLLRHTLGVGFVWAGLAVAWGVGHYLLGMTMPDAMSRFMLLEYIPWFVMGMTIYVSLRDEARWRVPHVALLAMCIIAVGLRGESEYMLAALATISLVLLASRGSLVWLASRPFVFCGAISYPLYLIHEKIGWAVLLQIEPLLPSVWLSIALAVSCSIAIATALHYFVEDPSRKALRGLYARHKSGPVQVRCDVPWFPRWSVAACAVLAVLVAGNVATSPVNAPAVAASPGDVSALLRIPATATTTRIPCGPAQGRAMRLILVLGQSNAASQVSPGATGTLKVYRDGQCWRVSGPVPGMQSGGLSVWSRVAELAAGSTGRYDLVFAPLAMEGAHISDWTGKGTLNRMLRHELLDLHRAAGLGLPVAAVVWQEEEADALSGTDAEQYRNELLALRRLIDGYGVTAPVLLGKSTGSCLAPASAPLHRAIDAAMRAGERLRPGADTDSLGDSYRDSGHCHFNARGRNAAARRWWAALEPALGTA